MAKKRSKRSSKSKSAWRSCAGVNSRTGKVKKGYKARRGSRCPVKVG